MKALFAFATLVVCSPIVSAFDVGILKDSSGNSFHAHIHKDNIPYGPVLSNITNDTFAKYGRGLAYPETDEAGFESLRGGATPSNIANVSLFFVYDGRDDDFDLEVALTGFPSIGFSIEYHFALRCAADGTFTFTQENIVSPPFFDQFDVPGACSVTGQHTMGFIRNHTSLELTMYFDGNTLGPFVYNETQAEGVIDPTALHLGNRQLLTVYETRIWDFPINETLMLDLMDPSNHDHDNSLTGELGAWFFEAPPILITPSSLPDVVQSGFNLIVVVAIVVLLILWGEITKSPFILFSSALGASIVAASLLYQRFSLPVFIFLAAIVLLIVARGFILAFDGEEEKKETD